MVAVRANKENSVAPATGSRIFAVIVATAAMVGGMFAVFLIMLFVWSAAHLPDISDHATASLPSSSIVYSSDGIELAHLHRERREPVSLNRVPSHFIQALVATEDRRFFEHHGVDWLRIATATFHSIMGHRQGGSTLTMQLVRNRYPSIAQAPLLQRKAQEILRARQLERRYDKQQILEMYVNDVPFGQRARGIKAAARAYFDKDLSELSISDTSTLVAVLKGSTYYNPLRSPERALVRRNLVLTQLEHAEAISATEAALHRDAPLNLSPNSQSLLGSIAPHAVRHVEKELAQWAEESGIDLYADGLRIHTTLDAKLQQLANEAVHHQLDQLQAVADYEWGVAQPAFLGTSTRYYQQHLEENSIEPFSYLRESKADVLIESPNRSVFLEKDSLRLRRYRVARTTLQSGFVALDPRSGRVKTWVGSRHFQMDEYDHVAQARRQPGSTFKPFVFAAAVDRGYHPDDRWVEGAVHPAGSVEEGGIRLREGMAYSNNALALHLTETISPSAVARTARRMGIESDLRAFPSLAFGTSEVSLLELASAYGTIANAGQHTQPHLIDRVEDAGGHILLRPRTETRRGSSALTSYALIDMMRDVTTYGTARDIRERFGIVDVDVAGKTGTTQNNGDGWFVMAHPHLVTGSWVGFNDRRIGFRSEHWGRGSNNALRIVGQFTRDALDAGSLSKEARFQPPAGYDTPRLQVQNSRDALHRGSFYDGTVGLPRNEAPTSDSGMDSSDATYVQDNDVEAALRRSLNPLSEDEDE